MSEIESKGVRATRKILGFIVPQIGQITGISPENCRDALNAVKATKSFVKKTTSRAINNLRISVKEGTGEAEGARRSVENESRIRAQREKEEAQKRSQEWNRGIKEEIVRRQAEDEQKSQEAQRMSEKKMNAEKEKMDQMRAKVEQEQKVRNESEIKARAEQEEQARKQAEGTQKTKEARRVAKNEAKNDEKMKTEESNPTPEKTTTKATNVAKNISDIRDTSYLISLIKDTAYNKNIKKTRSNSAIEGLDTSVAGNAKKIGNVLAINMFGGARIEWDIDYRLFAGKTYTYEQLEKLRKDADQWEGLGILGIAKGMILSGNKEIIDSESDIGKKLLSNGKEVDELLLKHPNINKDALDKSAKEMLRSALNRKIDNEQNILLTRQILQNSLSIIVFDDFSKRARERFGTSKNNSSGSKIDFFDTTAEQLLSQDPRGKAKFGKAMEDIARQMGPDYFKTVKLRTIKEIFIDSISSKST